MAEQGMTRKRGCLRSVGQLGCGVLGMASMAAVLGSIATGYMYYEYVVVDPGPHLEPAHVRSIIAQESPIYYRDGVTRLGVFFEDEHRQYVSTEELPLAWQMGIVAAEDGAYWSHPGISLKHLVRAMRDNARAGRVVAGGSTLSQQTAKNLYYRPDRSLKSKGTELVNAMRLEAHYDKHQILTFYANQFHVSGNGRGLGIAARYFFDKSPGELAVEEAAFISGLVKAPSRYDPFLGSEERRAGAREKAHDRTRYVLGRMTKEALEDLTPPRRQGETEAAYQARLEQAAKIQERARQLLDEDFELQFKRGTFRFDSSAVLDEVAARLAEPPFAAVLEQAGIEEPSTAGLKVITTLDPVAQRSAVYGLWHHLTEVGTELEKKTAKDFIVTGRMSYDPDRPLHVGQFLKARVVQLMTQPKRHLKVDLGGRECLVDRDGIIRVAAAIERGQKGSRSARVNTAEVDAVAEALKVDSLVWVSVKSIEEDRLTCDLELRPELQGAVMVLQDGEIRAMVGGNDNRNFNRTTALRQMGSTWKPLVFHTALQLGWSPAAQLDNRRNVFPFSTTYYYPRPDHDPDDVVSMSWAGVRSENLASVWLLYHLTDHLDGQAVAKLAASLGLARAEGEDEKAYRTRIQKLGVLPTRGRLAEIDFLMARDQLLKTGVRADDRLALQSLYYGWGFGSEADRVRGEGGREMQNKLDALKNSYKHLFPMMETCRSQHRLLEVSWKRGRIPDPELVKDLSVLVDEDGVQVACGLIPEGYGPVKETLEDLSEDGQSEPEAGEGGEEEPAVAVDTLPPAETAEEPKSKLDPLALLQEKMDQLTRRISRPKLVPFVDVLIEERLHAGTILALDGAVKRQQLTRQVGGEVDLYDPQWLYWHPDFRVLLSLSYLEAEARKYGVLSEIRPVLSLPLGANEITLEEVASIYQGLSTGQSWTFPGVAKSKRMDAPPGPSLLIAEIRDVDDNVLYRAHGEAERIASVDVADMTADILRNVVVHGTGRRAASAVRLEEGIVPLGGKTGTTNDFKNAAFAGFAPTFGPSGPTPHGGFTVAAYVGYDDNRPMKNGGIRIAGASGALPAWIGTIDGMAQGGLLGTPTAAPEEGGAWTLANAPSLVRVPASDEGGLAMEGTFEDGGRGILVPLPSVVERPEVEFEQAERPTYVRPRLQLTEPPPVEPERPRGLWGRRKKRREARDPN